MWTGDLYNYSLQITEQIFRVYTWIEIYEGRLNGIIYPAEKPHDFYISANIKKTSCLLAG
jgi:hypothetical protein